MQSPRGKWIRSLHIFTCAMFRAAQKGQTAPEALEITFCQIDKNFKEKKTTEQEREGI